MSNVRKVRTKSIINCSTFNTVRLNLDPNLRNENSNIALNVPDSMM